MNRIYVCHWEEMGSDYVVDEDGFSDEFNVSSHFCFTHHSSIEDAQKLAFTHDIVNACNSSLIDASVSVDEYTSVFCYSILEYHDNILVGKYSLDDNTFEVSENGSWRYYDYQDHWKESKSLF